MNFNVALREDELQAELLPEVSQPMTLDAVKPKFQPYLIRVREMADEAKAVEVTDDDSLKYAVSLGGDAKKIAKAIEAQRKKVIQEPSDFVKAVNNFCKLFTEQLSQAEAVLKKKISEYQYQQELERRKREEAARKAAKELQEKLNREAEEASRKAQADNPDAKPITAPVVQEPIVPKESNVTRTETGIAAYQRKTWTFEITDEAQIPREYLKIDEGKIRDAIKMGVREVPGLRIYETSTTVFRS